MNSSINIRDNKGDVIGVGIDGNGNIIGKNIVIYQVKRDFNLTYLTKNYFKSHSYTDDDFNKWLKGFTLSPSSIYQKREYRREGVISEIKYKLEEKKRLLLLGESGVSKSTLLMEVMCDYLENDYRVLYNLGNEEIKNENELTETLEGLAKSGNKVLVVIDNINKKSTSLIFHVINNLSTLSKEIRANIHFLLAARQPEFDWILEKNLWGDAYVVQIIEELFDENYKYSLPYFTKDEVKEFIIKYKDFLHITRRNKTIEENANEIFKDTQGHPIMVRFSVLNEGLNSHVQNMYLEYLVDGKNPHLNRVKIMILNSLFDISNISLTDKMLEEFVLLNTAEDLKNTIIKKTGDIWKTIHPRWDLELLKYMFSLKYNLNFIENSFSEIINNIINNQKITSFDKLYILNTVYYTFIEKNVIKLNAIEKMVKLKDIEYSLDDFLKVLFYVNVIGVAYSKSGSDEKALDFYDKALSLNYEYIDAYNNKGLSLSNLGQFEDAIKAYDKAIEINPEYVDAYYNKGNSLSRLGKYEDAIKAYDKAIEINPEYDSAYYNKGLSLSNLGQFEDAIKAYDKAIEINPEYVDAYYNKGNSLSRLGQFEDAIKAYDKAIEANPLYINALLGKSLSLNSLNKKNDAKQILNKVLDMDPQNPIALDIKKELEKED